jgi:glutamine synthetase
MAVHKYADILRSSIAHAGNDHRLGANEAPPAIISVFIGDAMSKLLNQIANGKKTDESAVKRAIDLISKLPNLELDNTDRNRTSPFAFTGNKFEIRAVGSSQNCAGPMTVMNTMMGLQLIEFKADVDKHISKGLSNEESILMVLKNYIRKSRAIIFEGNNYSDEWKAEAKERGLNNFANTPEALDVLDSKMAVEFFGKSGILNAKELEAFYLVQLHNYVTKLNIEAIALSEMVTSQVIPAVLRQQTELAQNIAALNAIGMQDATDLQKTTIKEIISNLSAIKEGLEKMDKHLEKAHHADSVRDEAELLCKKVKPQMEAIRDAVDALEGIVDDQYWPLVKYREILRVH